MAKAAVVSAALAVACFTAGRAEPERSQSQMGLLKDALRPRVRVAHGAPSKPEPRKVGANESRCPAEMVLVAAPRTEVCIDRWEASLDRREPSGGREPWPGNHAILGQGANMIAVSERGRKPQGYVSGAQAGRACSNAGKRLCEMEEWMRACRGSHAKTYPYGNQRRAGVCNDRHKVLEAHPVTVLFQRESAPGEDPEQMWTPKWMNDPRLHEMRQSVEPTGSYPECVSDTGAYDMVGNLHEWVSDPEGTFVGGFFMDTYQNGEGCGYRTEAHELEYYDYSTGFRCCRDAATG